MLASSLFFETSIPNTPSITVLSFHLVSSARAPLRTTLYAGSTLTRVPRYRPISKAELGKRGLIYGTGSRAKRPHRLTVLLAAGEIYLFAKQSATYKRQPHPRRSTFRDFVPWPVADAGCWRVWKRRCGRRPQPCTKPASRAAR